MRVAENFEKWIWQVEMAKHNKRDKIVEVASKIVKQQGGSRSYF